ncbi:MAG TPA: TIGR03621 family F420-dependent LLM class oxidoreductase [Verrucomicrobiae bacterium]|nr:TIGR03621 family F420-dependent LLM class oxidoreductase [Verrucomicrobiae bacterium]
MRPFRFAANAERGRSAEHWREVARRAEGLGYDTLLMPDHITDQLAPVAALTAIADATTTLRVGSFVFANDYRNPVMLAKEATTLDLLSGGRLEFGIGAGWNKRDYQQLGMPYDNAKVRVDRMEEAVALIKRLWTEEKVTHEGPHYRVREAMVRPRPTQRPHPPLMIGASGPRMLRIAAREAQIVALVPALDPIGMSTLRSLATESVEKRIATLRRAPRFSELELNVIVFDAAVTDRARSIVDGLTARLKSAVTAVVESPFVLYGSTSSIVEDLLRQRERLGISYIALPGRAMRGFGPVVAALRGK